MLSLPQGKRYVRESPCGRETTTTAVATTIRQVLSLRERSLPFGTARFYSYTAERGFSQASLHKIIQFVDNVCRGQKRTDKPPTLVGAPFPTVNGSAIIGKKKK